MSDTSDLNQRPKVIPKKVEAPARVRDAEAVAQAMAAAAPQTLLGPAPVSQQPPADVGEHPPAPEPAAPPVMAMHPADARRMDATRKATPEELAEHLEGFGPGFVRRPFAERQMRLYAPSRPGFRRRWVNDVPGRVAHFQERGYKHVTEGGKPISKVVSVKANGGGLDGYLMEIPIQWAEEDERASQRAADEIEATIRRGEVAVGDGSNRYVPRDVSTGQPLIQMQDERRGSPLAPMAGD